MAAALDSAHTFIRALKAPTDPPPSERRTKIELAQEAWDNATLYVPSKAEVLVDWVLSQLLKSKSVLLDARYWMLLDHILRQNALPTGNMKNSRAWLLPILNRIPVLPILAALLRQLHLDSVEASSGIFSCIRRSYAVLLPISVPKASQDALVDCFWALLHAFSTAEAQHIVLEMGDLPETVIQHFKDVIATSPSRRKICSSFIVDGHIAAWLDAEAHAVSENSRRVCDMLYSAVCDVLFSVDGIRHHVLVNDATEDGLFSRLTRLGCMPPAIAQETLPKLFSSFCLAARRQKTALLPERSTVLSHTNHLDDACIHFFRSCMAYLDSYPPQDQWPAFISFVDAIRHSNLYGRGSMWQGELKTLALKAALAMDSTTTHLPILLLTALLRLDYDLVSDISADIIKNIAHATSDSNHAAYSFASSSLDYACKTRTVDGHLAGVCASLKAAIAPGVDPRIAYARISRGVFFCYEWQREMTTAVTAFLTPGQATRLISELLSTLIAEYHSFTTHLLTRGSGRHEGLSEKTSHLPWTGDGTVSSVYLALHLQYVSAILCATFARSPSRSSSSLPVDDGLSALLRMIDDIDSSLRHHILGSKSWELGVLQACSLRSRYSIVTALSSVFAPIPTIPALLHTLHEADIYVPELRIELDRALLLGLAVSSDYDNLSQYVDSLLTRLEQTLDPQYSWDGFTTPPEAVATDAQYAATATWSLALLRWLRFIDDRWNPVQLRRLVKLIFRVQQSPASAVREGTARAVLDRVVCDASFWEHHNIVDLIAQHLTEVTQCLADIDMSKAIKRVAKHKPIVSIEELEQAIAAFRFALSLPTQVLNRSRRDELSRRAFLADIASSIHAHDEGLARRIASRRYIAHHAAAGLPSLPTEGLLFFVDIENVVTGPSQAFTDVTVEAANGLFENLLRAKEVDLYQALVSLLTEAMEKESDNARRMFKEQLVACLLRCVERIKPEQVEIINGTLRLIQVAGAHIDGMRKRLLGREQAYDLFEIAHALDLAVTIRKQVSNKYENELVSVVMPRLGRTLQSKCESRFEPAASIICSRLLVLVSEDLRANSQRAAAVVATYVVVARTLKSEDHRGSVDAPLLDIFKDLPVLSYESLLQELYEAIATVPRHCTEDLAAILRLSALLCREVPEGASRIARDHARLCMTVILNDDLVPRSPELRMEVLRLVESICRERAMSLQVQDIGQIWLLLAHTVAPSAVHDEETSPRHFTAIVAAATSLIRLRRDLVAPTLPHLCQVLRLLISALRSPRPQLGAKQLRHVCNELPRFVSARADGSGGLGADEARALARLLTALTSKTTILGRGNDTASLAQPFARHAPGILLAYMNVASAPLSVLPLAVRKELEPGMFALCSMAGEHGRDSLMAGTAGGQLDAASKAMFKALWKEFEKQRYVGTG